jgi:hypothetical protein
MYVNSKSSDVRTVSLISPLMTQLILKTAQEVSRGQMWSRRNKLGDWSGALGHRKSGTWEWGMWALQNRKSPRSMLPIPGQAQMVQVSSISPVQCCLSELQPGWHWQGPNDGKPPGTPAPAQQGRPESQYLQESQSPIKGLAQVDSGCRSFLPHRK